MRISDWSSDVCSSDLDARQGRTLHLIASGFPRLARDPEHRAFPGSGVTDDIANTASGRDMLQRAALLLRELQAAPSCPRDRKLTMAIRDAVMASHIKLFGRAFEPLLGRDPRARLKPFLTITFLADTVHVRSLPH